MAITRAAGFACNNYSAIRAAAADHMLAIVEHQHQAPRAKRARDRLRRCDPRSELEPERSSDGDRDMLGIGQGC